MPGYQCPTCQRLIEVTQKEEAPWRPFCSERCKMIDLHRWFTEQYRIEIPLPSPDPQTPLTRSEPQQSQPENPE